MKKDIMNVVVIGCSGMGRRHIKAVYQEIRANLYGICDIDQSRVESAAALYHPEKTTNDWHDFVNDPNVDGAIIVMPDQLHLEMTDAFLRAGKHVLCEKPMALTTEECEKMMQAEKDTGKKLMVGQVSRYAPAFAKAKEIIDSGRIGELYFVESEYAKSPSIQDKLLRFSKYCIPVMSWTPIKPPEHVISVTAAISSAESILSLSVSNSCEML